METRELPPDARLSAIFQQAQDVAKSSVDSNIPVLRFYRSSEELVRRTQLYEKEKNFKAAYFLALKTAMIFTSEIKKHRQYNTLTDHQRTTLKQRATQAVVVAERVKPATKQQVQIEFNQWQQEEAQRRKHAEDEARKNAVRTAPPALPVKPSAPPPPSYSTVNNSGEPMRRHTSISNDNPAVAGTKITYPADLVAQFKALTAPNSARNMETCGFLFGTMGASGYNLTHLYLPKQNGSSDRCQPTDQGEMEMFNFTGGDSNLVQFGWIHTHPSQTAFLSSVDMATQFSYQTLLPEAIAIVCSIQYNETKFLHLTELGMRKVRENLQVNASEKFTAYHDQRNQLQEECNFVQQLDYARIIVIDRRY